MPAGSARAGLAVVALAVFASGGGAASGPGASAQPPAPDVRTLGPQIGERVPDFSLTDQQGRTRTMASLMGPNGLVLVFNRSADW